jgi:hypothetical protein
MNRKKVSADIEDRLKNAVRIVDAINLDNLGFVDVRAHKRGALTIRGKRASPNLWVSTQKLNK